MKLVPTSAAAMCVLMSALLPLPSQGAQDDGMDVAGLTWEELRPPHQPSPRAGASMAYDELSGRIILFGGYGGSYLNDTWSFDGADWTHLSTAGEPPIMWRGGMAYDKVLQRLVLFQGDTDNDTWLFNGIERSWQKISTAHVPSQREGGAMFTDPATGHVMLFGGAGLTFLNDLWRFDGADWTQVFPAHLPTPRGQGLAAYDPNVGKVVLTSGCEAINENTWMWDGVDFSHEPGRGGREKACVAQGGYSSVTHGVVVFGGFTQHKAISRATYTFDAWNFTWSRLSPTKSPSNRNNGASAYHPDVDKLFIFGGFGDGNFYGDTWVLTQ